MSLFRRVCNVTVGTLALEAIDVEFKVKKDLKPKPNTCDLRIFNLNLTHRKAIESSTATQTSVAAPAGSKIKTVPVRIEAGYADGQVSQIFLGELRAAQTVIDGADMVTELSTGDGDAAIQSRLNVAVGPGTSISQALTVMLSGLGIGQGNQAKAITLLQQSGAAAIYTKGAVFKGSAVQYMTDFCRSAGLEWSIQDGQLQILNLGQPLDGQAVRLSSTTGLIGSPTVDTKGVLSCTSLMIPLIKPGVKLAMDGKNVKGGYRVTSVEYSGQTMGKDWYCQIEASKY